MLSESPLIKILVLTMRGLDMEVPSSTHFLKLALSSRAMMLFYVRSSDSLIISLDRGEFV